MRGPFKNGTLGNLVTQSQGHWEKRNLIRNQRYEVVKPFLDSDGDEHPVGEEWCFIGSMFSKFDDEITICVRVMSGEEWKFSLIWKQNKQTDVIEHWREYLKPRTGSDNRAVNR
jgi:hypothetical protein